MRIGIIGAGHIGGNSGHLFARAGHDILFSFSRDQAKLDALAQASGATARTGTPREAVAFGEVVMLSVPWTTIDAALAEAGDLAGKIVIDTTNQFGPGGVVALPNGLSAAAFNAQRMPGARLVKAYNTLTAEFQAQAAGRQGADRVVLFYGGEDVEAKRVVAELIDDSGFAPVDIGGWDTVRFMEAPRRPGAVYGEEYHLPEARAFVAQLPKGIARRDAPLLPTGGARTRHRQTPVCVRAAPLGAGARIVQCLRNRTHEYPYRMSNCTNRSHEPGSVSR